ncbi:MAG: transglycosylase SLT domain-containing protein, partial [Bryobacteraceae bacterium]
MRKRSHRLPGRILCFAFLLAGAWAQQARPGATDPVAALIASLEQQYESANELYAMGRLDEARAGFDGVVDRLLASSYDIREQPRLQRELDSLIDRIHALESDLITSGGFSNPQPQTTPLERIPELTFPVDPALRAQIENESRAALQPTSALALPLVLNDPVIRYIHYFSTTGRDGIESDLRRAGRYRAMIEQTLASVGVPSDLIYLAELESSFDPKLVSRSGARGMWQFMASRSDDYGLKRTHWVDERQDPIKSTLAAAQHLKDLYGEFGDWYLAMAAYNAGPATIQAIVARTGYADYWKLYEMGALPHYLRNYVPVILATAIIGKDPAKYGIEVGMADTPEAFDVETVTFGLDLRLAAECAQATVGDLQHLNPSLLHYEVPAGYTLRIPQGSASGFETGLARIPPRARLVWRLHWVRAGETWGTLARRYQVSVASLRRANGENSGDPGGEPEAGTPIALPVAAVRLKSSGKART